MRTITSGVDNLLREPDGDLITGTLRFTAEQNSLNIPVTTEGQIVVAAGVYSGDIEDGIYTVHLIIGDSSVKLGHGVAVVDGVDIDVLTLIGLDAVPPTVAQTILETMEALATQTAVDAVSTAADAVATGEDALATAADVIAAQAARDKAEQWAENPVNAEVEPGQYSALHWANVAETEVTTAISSAIGVSIPALVGGYVPISQLPPSVIERLVVVADEAARFALTTTTVQNGDTVKQNDTGVMYYVIDDTNLGNAAGYSEYTAGIASQVNWSGVLSTPTTLLGYGINDGAAIKTQYEAQADTNAFTDAEQAKLAAVGTDDTADSYTLNAINTALTGPSSVVAIAAFSVADDADGGAWVDKMAHTSWEQSLGKFPSDFSLTLETSALHQHDANDGSLWKTYDLTGLTCYDVAYSNGRIYIATSTGLVEWDFPQDKIDDIVIDYSTTTTPAIVNDVCNAVAVTALDGAPLNYVGLPVNTVAVGTGGGVSVIDGPAGYGTIVDLVGTTANVQHVAFLDQEHLLSTGHTSSDHVYVHTLPTTDIVSSTVYDYRWLQADATSDAGYPRHIGLAADTLLAVSEKGFGESAGLTLIRENPATPASGMVAYTTNTYATPYMKGDVEVCLDGSSLTDRSVTGTVITDNGTATFTVVNGGDLKYTTASGGTITAPVTTGGECYGWERVGGVWVFRSSISEWVGVSEAAGTLTIADGTIFTRLVYVNGAAPSSEQLSEIERTDTALFASGAAMLLPGASSAVLDLDYNESRDELTVTQADYVSTFRDLVRVDSVASQVGTLTSAAADRGVLVQGGSTGAHLAAEAVDVKSELAAANQRIAELGNKLPPYTLVGSSTTTVALPRGQRAVPGAVIFSGSSLLHEGAANDWTQDSDGFIWTVTFAAAQTGNISIPVERVKS